jgi:hypothetical protein
MCSFDARNRGSTRLPLKMKWGIRRQAQWKIIQPPSLRKEQASLEGSLKWCGDKEREPAHLGEQKNTAQDAQKGQPSHPPNPRRLLHPPTLSLPRQPLRPETRLIPSKAAANYHSLQRGGWDDPNCARHSHPPTHWHAETCHLPWRGPSDSFYLSFGGVAKAALDCAHRTSTVSSCAFCEQGGRLAAPPLPFSASCQ